MESTGVPSARRNASDEDDGWQGRRAMAPRVATLSMHGVGEPADGGVAKMTDGGVAGPPAVDGQRDPVLPQLL
jgi:hypothetical protein